MSKGLPKFEELSNDRQRIYKQMLEYNETHNDIEIMNERRIENQKQLDNKQIVNETLNQKSFENLTTQQKKEVTDALKQMKVGGKNVQYNDETGEMSVDISVPNPYRQVFNTYFYVKHGLIAGLDPSLLEPKEQCVMRDEEGDEWYKNWGAEKTDTFPQYT
tara:strand:- start:291 stop:773 length:483 start_codon:yes stop_codon:yes gene_type:complete